MIGWVFKYTMPRNAIVEYQIACLGSNRNSFRKSLVTSVEMMLKFLMNISRSLPLKDSTYSRRSKLTFLTSWTRRLRSSENALTNRLSSSSKSPKALTNAALPVVLLLVSMREKRSASSGRFILSVSRRVMAASIKACAFMTKDQSFSLSESKDSKKPCFNPRLDSNNGTSSDSVCLPTIALLFLPLLS